MSCHLFVKVLIGLFAIANIPLPLCAAVKVAGVFGDNMVLQADQPVKVWGWANPGEQVKVAVDDLAGDATTDADGNWLVTLQPHKAGGPYDLTVNGDFKKITNVMFGDVWICAGQSNMGFPTKNAQDAAKELADANYPGIRFCQVLGGITESPQKDMGTKWGVCTPQTAADFSAVGFFFARDIARKHPVPMGMIDVSIGGACVESFIRREALAASPETNALLLAWDADRASYDQRCKDYEAKLAEWKSNLPTNQDPKKPDPSKPVEPINPRDHQAYPTVIFNGRVAPLAFCGVRGVIWYQGETNASRIITPRAPIDKRGWTIYRQLFTMLITDWRHLWGRDDMPFYFVQLPNFATGLHIGGFTVMRDEQAAALALPHTAMAVTIDVGGGLHPVNKLPVGLRLAACARALDYGETNLAYIGPTFKSMAIAGNTVTVTFDHAEGGLVCAGAPGGFMVAEDDKIFKPVTSRVDGDTVILQDPKIAKPGAVRYGYVDNPLPPCNLYNQAGLPAVPFRTDHWDLTIDAPVK